MEVFNIKGVLHSSDTNFKDQNHEHIPKFSQSVDDGLFFI